MNKKTSVIFLAAAASFAIFGQAMASGCKPIAGTAFFTDGVSRFSDAKCQKEMIGNFMVTTSTSGTVVSVATGNSNCRYNVASRQYTDGTAFFTDNRCQNEALNGETVAAVAGASTVSLALASVVGASEYAQLFQRIDALEKRMATLQSIMVQMLALMKK